MYARQIETHQFSERAIHFFYYVFGWLFLQVTKPFHVPTDTALIAMSSILMTIALSLSWRLYRAMGEGERTSRSALFVLLFAGVVIQQGTEAEVYALQMVLSLLSYLAYLRGRPVLAGLALGLATLDTPLGVLAVGFFVAELIRTRQWKRFLIMGVVGSLTFFAGLSLVWHDYFYGTRGLLVDTNIQQNGTRFMANVIAIGKNFHFLLPFLLIGVVVAWRERRYLLLLLGTLTVFHLPAILTATEGGVFLLPLYPILTLVIALGVQAGLDATGTRRTLTQIALVLYAVTSLLVWTQPYDRKFRDGLVEGLHAIPPGAQLVTTWSFCMTLEFYGGVPRDTLIESRELLWPEERNQLAVAIRGDRPLFLMEAHYPTKGVRWLLPRALQERHYEQNALMPRLHRQYGAQGTLVFSKPGAPRVYRLSPP